MIPVSYTHLDVYKRQVRVSLANLNEADYVKIGQSIKRVLEEYAQTWKASKE